jgi:hypothetical protein
LRRIQKPFAVGATAVLAGLALTPAALAAGSARVSSARVGSAASLPASAIKGSPAKFSPSSLSAKSKQTSSSCTLAQASFGILNKESKNEKVTFFVGSKNEGSVTIPKGKGEAFCFAKGSHGTLVGKLSDGKKLTVHIS